MSEALRETALNMAIRSGGDPEEIVRRANVYLAFLRPPLQPWQQIGAGGQAALSGQHALGQLQKASQNHGLGAHHE